MKLWKIGIGTGLIILGLYFLFNQEGIVSILIGSIGVAVGVGLIVSD